MSSLMRRQNGNAVDKQRSGAPIAGSYAEDSTLNREYTASNTSWETIENALPPSAQQGATIASSVDAPAGASKTPQGEFYQKRIAWRVTPQDVSIYSLRRNLVRNGDNKFKPQGQWFPTETKVFPFASSPGKRTGEVPFSSPIPGASSAKAFQQQASEDGVAIHETLMLLPSVVQAHVLRLITNPTYEHGKSWLYSDDGMPTKNTLEYLRIDGDNAIVITAERSLNSFELSTLQSDAERHVALSRLNWNVTQTTGKLLPLVQSIEGRTNKTIGMPA